MAVDRFTIDGVPFVNDDDIEQQRIAAVRGREGAMAMNHALDLTGSRIPDGARIFETRWVYNADCREFWLECRSNSDGYQTCWDHGPNQYCDDDIALNFAECCASGHEGPFVYVIIPYMEP